MKFLMTSNIDINWIEADSEEEAIVKFKEKLKFEKSGSAIKDFFLCNVIASDINWTMPRGFHVHKSEVTQT